MVSFRAETNASSTTRFLEVPELPDGKYSDPIVDQFFALQQARTKRDLFRLRAARESWY